MNNGTITVISSRPLGPQDYAQMGYQACMKDIQSLYGQIMRQMNGANGGKGKGDVEPSKDTKSKAAEVKSKGRGNDTELAHITPGEAKKLKAGGGSGSRNPKTGLLEFDDGGGDGGGDSGAGAGGSESGGPGGGLGGSDTGGGEEGGAGASTTESGGPASVGFAGGETDNADQGGPSGAMSGYGGPATSSTPEQGLGIGAGLSLGPGETDQGAPTTGPTAVGNTGLTVSYDDPLSTQSQALATATGSRASAGLYGGIGSSDPAAASAAFGTGENAADPESSFGQGVADALASVMGHAGPLGMATSGQATPTGLAASVMGLMGGVPGMLGGVVGLGDRAASMASGDSKSGEGMGFAGSGGTGGIGGGPAGSGGSQSSPGGSSEDGIFQDSIPGSSGTTARGNSSNVDSAVQSIFSRPGSRTIAGTPYAPSFGGSDTVNPAALSAALGAINRPRPGPGLNFGRTTYL